MIDLVLVKRDMCSEVGERNGTRPLRPCAVESQVSGNVERGGDFVVGARRVRSEKLRKHHYREGYARSF